MSRERVQAFIHHVNSDTGLFGKVEALNGNLTSLIKLAAETGFDFTAEDWTGTVSAIVSGELNDSDLDSVSGGILIALTPIPQVKWFNSFNIMSAGPGAGPHI